MSDTTFHVEHEPDDVPPAPLESEAPTPPPDDPYPVQRPDENNRSYSMRVRHWKKRQGRSAHAGTKQTRADQKAKRRNPTTPADVPALELMKADVSPSTLRKAIAGTVDTTAAAIAMAGAMKGDKRLLYDAEIISGKSQDIANELVAAAEQNPALYRALVGLVKGSQWAKLSALVVSIVVPIAANHGALPRGMATMVGAPMPPEVEDKKGGESVGVDRNGRAPGDVAGAAGGT